MSLTSFIHGDDDIIELRRTHELRVVSKIAFLRLHASRMCSAKQKKEKMQNKQTEKRVQEKKVDLVAWKFRTVSEGLKGSTVAVCRCSPFHMT